MLDPVIRIYYTSHFIKYSMQAVKIIAWQK